MSPNVRLMKKIQEIQTKKIENEIEKKKIKRSKKSSKSIKIM